MSRRACTSRGPGARVGWQATARTRGGCRADGSAMWLRDDRARRGDSIDSVIGTRIRAMTRYRVSLAVLVAAWALLPTPVTAQATPQDPSVFRTGTRLVRVNVTVHDSSGRAVTDLRAGDFTIRDSGRIREVA